MALMNAKQNCATAITAMNESVLKIKGDALSWGGPPRPVVASRSNWGGWLSFIYAKPCHG